MALYDVIDDIAKKDIIKTDTGDNRIFGVVIGEVVSNYNEKFPGRVCVTITNRDAKANELKWARVVSPYSGKKWGEYFQPEIGDQVLVAFEQGNIEKPYVIGSLPREGNQFLKDSADQDNSNKRIVTKNGNTLTFYDDKDGGDKDKIFIRTHGSQQVVELDNEKKTINIKDKDKQTVVSMNAEKGIIDISAEKQIKLRCGDTSIIINGEKKTITVNANEINLKATKGLSMQSQGNTTIKGSTVSQEATGGAMMVKSGSVVKLDSPAITM